MLELHLSVTNQPRTSLVVWGLDRVLTPPPGLQDNPHYQIDESYFVGCLARYHNYSYLGSDCCHQKLKQLCLVSCHKLFRQTLMVSRSLFHDFQLQHRTRR
jgi:hypothetical protein